MDLNKCSNFVLNEAHPQCEREKKMTQLLADQSLLEASEEILKTRAYQKDMNDQIVECEQINKYIVDQNTFMQQNNDKLRMMETDLKMKLASFESCN
jgi:hypothetical protein